jgi:hypothetical protein
MPAALSFLLNMIYSLEMYIRLGRTLTLGCLLAVAVHLHVCESRGGAGAAVVAAAAVAATVAGAGARAAGAVAGTCAGTVEAGAAAGAAAAGAGAKQVAAGQPVVKGQPVVNDPHGMSLEQRQPVDGSRTSQPLGATTVRECHRSPRFNQDLPLSPISRTLCHLLVFPPPL